MTFTHGDIVLLPKELGGQRAWFDRYQSVCVDHSALFAPDNKCVAIVHCLGVGHSLALYADQLRPEPKPEPVSGEFHTDSAGVRYVNTGDIHDTRWVRMDRPPLSPKTWYSWAEIRER